MMQFTGKNVLITGASKGIEVEIAKTLASMGLKVWINYRSNAEVADALKNELEEKGYKAVLLLNLMRLLKAILLKRYKPLPKAMEVCLIW